MSTIIACFPNQQASELAEVLQQLEACPQVSKVWVDAAVANGGKTEAFDLSDFSTSAFYKRLAAKLDGADYLLLATKTTSFSMGQFAVERMMRVAEDTAAGMVYTDYKEVKEGKASAHPTIDYHAGSLRDDFNFGPLVLINANALRLAVAEMTQEFQHAGWYYTRLKISQHRELFHLQEFLYTIDETDLRKSGQKIFDYVDPKNRAVQIEMEQAATEHLKNIGAYLAPEFKPVDFSADNFELEASVVIPVYNRAKTIADAIKSVLSQKADFDFNLIIVDNHSSDGTTDIIAEYAAADKRVVHLVPQRYDLGIGGCWNEGVQSAHCGRFAVQLDSDDLYRDENTLQTIVDTFRAEGCAMVVGSYQLVNFALEEIPPGLIDHREWTPDNGRNNALRINGLGAPRAFYTPVLRDIKVPNTSYGEDYALGLSISRNYQIGRVYTNLYLCRRWDDNSDAALDIEKMNKHNLYKDRIRTIELRARQQLNRTK